ncbi:hypothetical protein J1N35_021804 [Gossypium stocksii]|uniref:Uncharacterized protein n=1 Tax=Gossypium stocksii TaxID=47602 RepID=A0A9D4A1N3_9ROSI|nr:hypothetical protein J1N35_021804 [Gossypium stocksii]
MLILFTIMNLTDQVIDFNHSLYLHSSNTQGADLTSFSASVSHKKMFKGICDHCKIKGHKRKNYYRLIGYPLDFKFTKKKISIGFVVNNAMVSDSSDLNIVVVGDNDATINHQAPLFTDAQY